MLGFKGHPQGFEQVLGAPEAHFRPRAFKLSMDDPQILFYLVFIPHMLFALSIHEASHAGSAYLLGDDTAALEGRVTLNPIRHIDPVGLIAFFIIHFGWARPTPVNPARFSKPGRDDILVSFAGPGSNLLAGVILLVALRAAWVMTSGQGEAAHTALAFLFVGAQLNVGLCFFNLIPVPPLDGSHILLHLLPRGLSQRLEPLMNYGWIILLMLIFGGSFFGIPLFFYLIGLPMVLVMRGLLGGEAMAGLFAQLSDFRFFV